ncbi:MAG TPA: hypothetical protein VJ010_00450 [Actinomycetota bacterium]|nr:hypothetical protein [Actinomycetota bacterium]
MQDEGKAAPGADPLEPIRTPIQEAGSQLAAALRACERLPSDSPDVADIRQCLCRAALLISRAEVRSYPVRQGFGRLLLERESQDVTLWARWRVVDEVGALVGTVVEAREWLGHACGPPTFTVAHNPTGGQGAALWASSGHSSPMLSLAALVDHLERR